MMYSLWMEWDFGQETVVFTTWTAAMNWADETLAKAAKSGFGYSSYKDAAAAGLASIQELEVVS
jgi:hypothetical protein